MVNKCTGSAKRKKYGYDEASMAIRTATLTTHHFLEMVSEKVRVVIVGSGVAGIGAASMLMERGVSHVLVLEAMDRIGGRINYKTLGKYGGVDLGGHWIHGQGGNILYEIAEPLGLVQHSGDYKNVLLLRDDGTQIHLGTSNDQIYELLFSDLSHLDESEKDKTYLQLSNERLARFLENRSITKDDIGSLQRHFAKSLCTLESCSDLADVSLKKTDYDEGEGDRLIEWKTGGMANILHLLMGTHRVKTQWSDLGVREKIRLSSRVSKLEWAGSDSIDVTTESGDVYEADFVIFTPSLNVLKKKHSSIFNPPLPREKVEAIELLGMDVVDKVYLVFEEPWWRPEDSTFSLVHPLSFPSQTQDWGEDIIAFARENHNEHVLGAWLIGEAAKRMERDSDEQVTATCMRILRKYLQRIHPNIPDPVSMIRSCWWSCEDVAGSYSYNSVAADGIDDARGILSQPLTDASGKPRILFAGEATSVRKWSSVHGALETGRREAQRISQYITGNKPTTSL